MSVVISNPTVEFCSHPVEGLRIIRKRKRNGRPMPEVLMVKDPQDDVLVKRMRLKVEKLTGKKNCPNIVIVPVRQE